MREMRNTGKIVAVQPEEMNCLGDQEVYRGIALKWSLMNWDLTVCALDPLASG